MQTGPKPPFGTPFSPPAPGASVDFLGLEADLARRLATPAPPSPVAPPRAAPPAPRAQVRVLLPSGYDEPVPPSIDPRASPRVHAFPPAEELRAGETLRAHWPEDRPNTWRASHGAAGLAAVPERASWLLALDDAEIPAAHPTFVTRRAPTNASFSDGVPVGTRVAPWFVRTLLVAAGLFFVAVVTKTLIAQSQAPAPAMPAIAEPEPPRAPPRALELATPPGRDAASLAGASTSARAAQARAAEEPRLVAVHVLPRGTAPDAAQAARERGDVAAFLAEESRSSAPLSDTVPGPDAVRTSTQNGVWEGTTIPVEALGGSLRLATPAVGRVRARLANGDRAEGRLSAIGQGRVWIETEGGPLEIERDRLRALEQIADRASPGPEAPRRQRVRTAGGVFYGRLLARDGRTVTLITDSGTRLTVEAEEISDADPDEGS